MEIALPLNYPSAHSMPRCANCGNVTGGLKLVGDVFIHSKPERCRPMTDKQVREHKNMMMRLGMIESEDE